MSHFASDGWHISAAIGMTFVLPRTGTGAVQAGSVVHHQSVWECREGLHNSKALIFGVLSLNSFKGATSDAQSRKFNALLIRRFAVAT